VDNILPLLALMPFLPIPYYLLVAGGGFPSLRDTQHIRRHWHNCYIFMCSRNPE